MDSLGFGVPDSTKGDLLGGFINSTYMYTGIIRSHLVMLQVHTTSYFEEF